MEKFRQLGLSKKVLSQIERQGFETPTEIQRKALPPVLEGKDVIGESATGSGKTLVFGCGIVELIRKNNHISALVLTPTRELAEQIKDMISKYSKSLNVIAIYGGVSLNPQIQKLKIADIVVATPGRLLDQLNRGNLDLKHIDLLVLDEADRMLDMGFIPDVKKIVRRTPKRRQTLFFSATVSGEVRHIAKQFMRNPVLVSADNQVDPSKLKQYYYNVPKNLKLSLLVHLLKEETSDLVMVFCNTRRTVNFVSKNLKRNKIDALPIHGGFSQNKRTRVMKKFNNGRVEALVCTDVAARGLDIGDVSHIYNYDIPRDKKDYVHRIGRTARAGESGKVINLLTPRDHKEFRQIKQEYRDFNIDVLEMPRVKRVHPVKSSRNRRRGRGRRGRGRRRRR